MSRRKRYEKGTRVEFHWHDACSRAGWCHKEEVNRFLQDKTLACCSTGYVIEDKPHALTVCQSQNASGAVGELLRVPWSLIGKNKAIK